MAQPGFKEALKTAPIRHVQGKFLVVDGQRFFAKAVTYGSFAPNEADEPFPPFGQLCDDFARMQEHGINTVRLYAPPSDRIADAAHAHGLYLIPEICWGPRRCELDEPDRVQFIFDWVRQHARRLAGHPAVLFFSLGNEIPPLIVRWYGRRRIERFLQDLCDTVRQQAPDSLLTYCNHPPTEYLDLSCFDIISFNIYLERQVEFRNYLARLQLLAGEKPLFLSEIGLDSRRHGFQEQAQSLEWQLRAAYEKGLCGAAVYAWTDEWTIFDQAIEGWAFGLTDSQRQPKPALELVQWMYTLDKYDLRPEPWPRVSVVVASYNGGRTLQATLEALEHLDYPDYEVIVVDDGSTDETPQIVEAFDVRSIRVPNGGLSRARNLGIEAATGALVAFTDSDACPEPDWLYFLVTALEEQRADAVGGPNLGVPTDGFLAQCIDHAPGNPTHVLLDDQLAEHIAGCNMAFRKEALLEIGCFDPIYRAAGDDVDVCWKLLARGRRIAFAPAAIVWHHRRGTVRGYLRQQRGYGMAESVLQRHYPGRFNIFGDLVWKGSIYDRPHMALRQQGLPRLFRPRVYQGWFGGAMFQSIYQPFQAWWFQIFTTAEWQVLSWFVLATGGLGWWLGSWVGPVFGSLGVAMGLTAFGAGHIAALQGLRSRPWRGMKWLQAGAVVAFLHIVQPLVRAGGMLLGWLKNGVRRPPLRADRRVWGNIAQRQDWLEALLMHLHTCGWICRPSEEWDDSDIDVIGPGPYRLQIDSTYEEDLERDRHMLRFRIRARRKKVLYPLWAGLAGALLAVAAYPALLPLAPPLLFAVYSLARARRRMVDAVAQLAEECAMALGMPPVDPEG